MLYNDSLGIKNYNTTLQTHALSQRGSYPLLLKERNSPNSYNGSSEYNDARENKKRLFYSNVNVSNLNDANRCPSREHSSTNIGPRTHCRTLTPRFKIKSCANRSRRSEKYTQSNVTVRERCSQTYENRLNNVQTNTDVVNEDFEESHHPTPSTSKSGKFGCEKGVCFHDTVYDLESKSKSPAAVLPNEPIEHVEYVESRSSQPEYDVTEGLIGCPCGRTLSFTHDICTPQQGGCQNEEENHPDWNCDFKVTRKPRTSKILRNNYYDSRNDTFRNGVYGNLSKGYHKSFNEPDYHEDKTSCPNCRRSSNSSSVSSRDIGDFIWLSDNPNTKGKNRSNLTDSDDDYDDDYEAEKAPVKKFKRLHPGRVTVRRKNLPTQRTLRHRSKYVPPFSNDSKL